MINGKILLLQKWQNINVVFPYLFILEMTSTAALNSCGYCDSVSGPVIFTNVSMILSVLLICSVAVKLLNDSVRFVIYKKVKYLVTVIL